MPKDIYAITVPIEFGDRMVERDRVEAESSTDALHIYFKKLNYDCFEIFKSVNNNVAVALDLTKNTILYYAFRVDDWS